MKKMFLMFIGVALFILIVGVLTKTQTGEETFLTPYLSQIQFGPTAKPEVGLTNLKEVVVGKTVIMAQITDTDSERQKGLSGITNLPAGQGMLFVFSDRNIVPTFWMKGMKIPLDFIWIKDGRVSEINTNIPAPSDNTPDNQLSVYRPSGVVDFILEVNAGFVERNKIKIGDGVLLSQI